MEGDNLVLFKASRGYNKGAITRLHNFTVNGQMPLEEPLQALISKRDRLLSVFQEYESYNKQILAVEPNDNEDVAKVESKYFYALSVLNEIIEERSDEGKQDCHHTTIAVSKTKLPTIQLPIFSGNYSEYIPFKPLLDSLMHNDKSLYNLQKLYYLRSYLKDEPFDLIKNLPLTINS